SDFLRRQWHAFGWGLIENGSPHTPPQERLGHLQSLVGGDRRPPLLDGGNDLNDIAFGNLVDAPAGPGLTHLPAKEPRDLAPGAVLRQPLRYEGFQEILDTICYDPSLRLALLGRRIAAVELGGEHSLRCHSCLVEGHAPVWPDGVFAQLRAGAADTVQNDEHLAALRRDLHAEARTAGVPVNYVGLRGRQRVDCALGQPDARHGRHLSCGATFT